jgi:hypothetical protein
LQRLMNWVPIGCVIVIPPNGLDYTTIMYEAA